MGQRRVLKDRLPGGPHKGHPPSSSENNQNGNWPERGEKKVIWSNAKGIFRDEEGKY